VALLVSAVVLSVVVVVVLQRLDALLPGSGAPPAAVARMPVSTTAPAPVSDSAPPMRPRAGTAPADTNRGPSPGDAKAPRTRTFAVTTAPTAIPAAAQATPWRPAPEQAFADSLYRATQSADTATARALLARRPSTLPDSIAAGAERLEARLARALGDTSRQRTAYAAVLRRDTTAAMRREAAEAAREAGDFLTASRLLRQLVAAAPRDTTLRAALLETLLSARDSAGFLGQLDTLARVTQSADRYDRLAVSREAAGDIVGARGAFREAIRVGPTAERWTRLADRLRWVDSLDASLLAYAEALALQPAAGRALEGTAIASRLRREALQSPIFIAPLSTDPEAGVALRVQAGDDNAGWSFRAIGAQTGIPITAQGLTLLAAADVRRIGRPLRDALHGTRWSAGLAQTLGRARVAARGGQVRHDGVRAVTTWAVDARAPLGRFEVRGEAERAPAYEVLRAGATLAPIGSDTALTARALRGTLLGTLRPGLDLWTQAEQIRFGDANQRTGAQLALQQSLRPGIGLILAGGVIGFRQSLPTYWTPSRYALGSIGLDLRTGVPSQVAVYVRLLPGIGDVRGLPVGNGRAFQFAAGAGAVIERGRWRATADAAAGRDREDGYQTWSGELRLTRLLP